jgi:hypothetical protein
MPVMYILDFKDGTADQYDAVIERMQLGGRLPAGAIFHSAGPTDSGWRVVDVWETSDIFQRFAQEKIAPLSVEAGLGAPEIRRLEVEQLRRGADKDVEFLQIGFIPGVDRAAFEDLDRHVLGDVGLPPDCVFHVNGAYDGGQYVMDAWTSKAERDRFRENQIKPGVQAAGIDTVPEFQDLALHNSLRHPAETGAVA